MLAGRDDPEDILRSVRRGLYAVNFGGGQVDITNGKFVFSASEAYLIEDGKVTSPVKGATLIGDGPTVLTRVAARSEEHTSELQSHSDLVCRLLLEKKNKKNKKIHTKKW